MNPFENTFPTQGFSEKKLPQRFSPWEAGQKDLIVEIGLRFFKAREAMIVHIAKFKDSKDIVVAENAFVDLESERAFPDLLEAIKARGYSSYSVERLSILGETSPQFPADLIGMKDGWPIRIGDVPTLEQQTGKSIQEIVDELANPTAIDITNHTQGYTVNQVPNEASSAVIDITNHTQA